MSDNIPIDLPIEIIRKVSDLKSWVRFTSVSKAWKSFIESAHFIKGYGAHNTQPRSHILFSSSKFICLVDDDNKTFKVQQQDFAPFVLSPLLKQYNVYKVVGGCHGLLCLHGHHKGYQKPLLVIWNPSIGKSFGIAAHTYSADDYGFGVCPVTKDPTVVKMQHYIGRPWLVEVFKLSSGVWNVVPRGNLPRQSIQLNLTAQVVIDRFIYWGAYEEIPTDNGEYITNRMVVSFDMITKEFKVIDLPDILTNQLYGNVSVSKLRECLVVYGSIYTEGAECCGIWVMERDSSFRKLFSIGSQLNKILKFSKNGEPIFEIRKAGERFTTLNVYDPSSLQIKNLGICIEDPSSFMGSYKESLLLLDQSQRRSYLRTRRGYAPPIYFHGDTIYP